MSVARAIRGLLAFVWDFVVGDDWTIAVVVVLAIAATDICAHHHHHLWWPIAVAVPAALSVTLWRSLRVARTTRH